VPEAGVVGDGTGFGAAPVLSNDAPTDDKPPLGSELEEPDVIEEMPLMDPIYHLAGRKCLGSKHP
jgi:hypothetical protein